MIREAFFYLLGGVTFLPLCILAILVHFHLTSTPYSAHPHLPSSSQSSQAFPSDIELTQARKEAALDLAATNAALHAEIQANQGKDRPQGPSTAPPSAKRLGPSTATALSKPHLSGWLTIRPRFQPDGEPTSAPPQPSSSNPTASASGSSSGQSDPSKVSGDGASAQPTPASNSYVSQMYKGIMDYRNRSTQKTVSTGAGQTQPPTSASSSDRNATDGSNSPQSSTASAPGKEQFHCILKAPILYLYSSDDVSSPLTECHAAIDLRGKRVSIYVSGMGDTIGELEEEVDAEGLEGDNGSDAIGSSSRPRSKVERLKAPADPARQWDTQSSAGSDAEMVGMSTKVPSAALKKKLAKSGWSKAKRAAIRDGELFMKRNAIRIVGPLPSFLSRKSRAEGDSEGEGNAEEVKGLRRPQWFIFNKNTCQMEDWYHALLQASLMPKTGSSSKSLDAEFPEMAPFSGSADPIGPLFSKSDMSSLLSSLDSLPDPIPLRWLNAIVGRVFFSVYRTAWIEDYITRKMMKKISRVRTPGFLSDVRVREVDIGRRAPGFSRPMLKSLTSDGEASMEVACHYTGEIRLTISTNLTISLGSRFKPYTVSLLLAVVLRSLDGNLLLRVKPPPSNRLWFGFTSLPKMQIDVEPVVSERKVQWGMVTRLIESRIRDLMTESIVVPNMDDVPFFDTRPFLFRGGIFADAGKRGEEDAGDDSTEDARASANTGKQVPSKSAPVSGVATPVAEKDGPEGGSSGQDDVSAANSTGRSSASSQGLRNRKSVADNLGAEISESLSRVSSPAAAGLSSLLSRDRAASTANLSAPAESLGNSLSKSPPGKRRSWFVGPRFGSSGTAQQDGMPSDFPHGSIATRNGRRVKEQSSLAWGNASLSLPPAGKAPSSDSAGSLSFASPSNTPSSASRQPTVDSDSRASPSHEKNKGSISSVTSSVLGTDESAISANTEELNRSFEAAALESFNDGDQHARNAGEIEGEDFEPSLPTPTSSTAPNSRTPSVRIQRASEDLLSPERHIDPNISPSDAEEDTVTNDTVLLEDRSLDGAGLSSIKTDGLEPAGVRGILNESPSSMRSTSTFARSLSSSPMEPGIAIESSGRSQSDSSSASFADTNSDATRSLSTADASSSTSVSADMSGFSSDRKSITSSTASTSSNGGVRSSAHGFAPPLLRSSVLARPPADSRNEAAANLSSVQKSRYGLGATTTQQDGAATSAAFEGAGTGSGAAGATTLNLISSWNKAKASMADKESRQAAAKEAKDALKRGWASWNAKRAERANASGRLSPSYRDSEQSSEGLSTSRSASWLASSPPDPVSMGAGLDRSESREDRPSLANASGQSQTSLSAAEARARLRVQASGPEDGQGSGSNSGSAGTRTPYKELRASKAARDQLVPPQSRQGISSATAPKGESGVTNEWDLDVPSIAAPAPTMRRRTESTVSINAEKPRNISGSSSNGGGDVQLGTSPSSKRLLAEGGGVSFIPPAPLATTGLASASGFPESSLSPPLQTSSALTAKPTQAPLSISEPAVPSSSLSGPPSSRSPPRVPSRPSQAASSGSVGSGMPRSPPTTFSPELRALPDVVASSPPLASGPLLSSPQVGSAWQGASPQPSSSPPVALSQGIKTQPGRAQMMAIPGIPSMQKSGPQSFSAPPPAPASTSVAGSSIAHPSPGATGLPASTKAGGIFKLPFVTAGPPNTTTTPPSAFSSSSSSTGEVPPSNLVPPQPTGAETKQGDPTRSQVEVEEGPVAGKEEDEPEEMKVAPTVEARGSDPQRIAEGG
ncbi:hypothetical protein IE53DRAFT_155620 [Violaceomyces palustris]|uniref:Uncharacterized protein n=1 Tax=Violaceomyces palustris TaxID=1673888 RepID=A0ACD0NTX8_9BASI|nr:hypothetical protein IE53DRAFT_155620 [Violaceomyces palustris]